MSFIQWVSNKKDIATWFNNRYPSLKYALINKEDFPVVRSKTGELYSISPDLCTYHESQTQYKYHDIQMTDVVIDIGANIGAFSLLAAKRCKWVHSYEPVLFNQLRKNIELNVAHNIVPHCVALGDGKPVKITWNNQTVEVPTKTLSQIVSDAERCDYLKCDAEGAEWGILPSEIINIPRIEIELHHFSTAMKTTSGRHLVEEIRRYFNYVETHDSKHDTHWISGVMK